MLSQRHKGQSLGLRLHVAVVNLVGLRLHVAVVNLVAEGLRLHSAPPGHCKWALVARPSLSQAHCASAAALSVFVRSAVPRCEGGEGTALC